jgi:hypothetical protein
MNSKGVSRQLLELAIAVAVAAWAVRWAVGLLVPILPALAVLAGMTLLTSVLLARRNRW